MQVFASENRDLASQLASYNFLSEPTENTKAAEVAASESLRLAGPTGLEPATSGVTGRRSNRLNYDPASVLLLTFGRYISFPRRRRIVLEDLRLAQPFAGRVFG